MSTKERKKAKKPPMDECKIDPSQEEKCFDDMIIDIMRKELLARGENEFFVDSLDFEMLKAKVNQKKTKKQYITYPNKYYFIRIRR